MANWTCTDNDTMQFRKKNSDGTYEFIEKINVSVKDSDDAFMVKSAAVNLSKYSDKDKEKAVSSYYGTLSEVRSIFEEEAEDIIAECIFEEMLACDSHITICGEMSEQQADLFILQYINEKQLVTLLATEQDGLDTRTHAFRFLVNKEYAVPDKLKERIREISTEYCKTEEGKQVLDHNCHSFNYGDFVLIPQSFMEKYGVQYLADTPDIIDVIFNEDLVSEIN